jgi:hypothetical protein
MHAFYVIAGNHIRQADLNAGLLPLALLTSLQGKKQKRMNKLAQGQEICVHASCPFVICTYLFRKYAVFGFSCSVCELW